MLIFWSFALVVFDVCQVNNIALELRNGYELSHARLRLILVLSSVVNTRDEVGSLDTFYIFFVVVICTNI